MAFSTPTEHAPNEGEIEVAVGDDLGDRSPAAREAGDDFVGVSLHSRRRIRHISLDPGQLHPGSINPIPLVAGVAAFYALCLTFLAPQFATNDDSAMWGIASGSTYGSPSEDLVFINPLLGSLLRFLYEFSDQFPWYATLFIGLQITVISVMVIAIARFAGLSIRTFAVVVAVIIGLVASFAVEYQFTVTSILSAGAGLVLVVAGSFAPEDDATSGRRGIVAGFLFGLSFLIRANGLTAVVVFGAPLLGLAVWKRRSELRPVVTAAMIALAIVGLGLAASELNARSDPAQAEFDRFNAARSQLHATPRLTPDDELAPILDEIGWTWADRAMFNNWFYTNSDVFETEDLELLVAERSDVRIEGGLSSGATEAYGDHQWKWVLLISSLLLLGAGAGRRRALFLFGFFAWFAVVSFGVASSLRFPDRVADPLFLVAILATVASGLGRRSVGPRSRSAKWLQPLAFLTLALAAGVLGSRLIITRADRAEISADRRHEFEEVRDVVGDDGVVVNWGGFLALQTANPFLIEQHPANDLEIVGLGWRSRSPQFDRQLARNGLSNVELAIADRPDVAVVASPHLASIFSAYMWDHYQRAGVLWPSAFIRGGQGAVYESFVESIVFDGRIELISPWNTVAAYADLGVASAGELSLVADSATSLGSVSGWARHPQTGASPDGFLVLIDGTLAAFTDVVEPRPGLVESTGDPSMLMTGFFIAVPAARLEAGVDVRVVALYGSTWAEILRPGSS